MSADREIGLLRRIRDDWKHHKRDWTEPGFRAIAVYRFGAWHGTLTWAPIRWLAYRIYRLLQRYVRNHYAIELPHTATIGKRVRIAHPGGVIIHRHAVIGDDCLIRQGVTLGVSVPAKRQLGPVLGNRVRVGAGAVIVGDVHIGDNVRIGPNAVVLSDVPDGATVFAPPARVIHTDRASESPGESASESTTTDTPEMD